MQAFVYCIFDFFSRNADALVTGVILTIFSKMADVLLKKKNIIIQQCVVDEYIKY